MGKTYKDGNYSGDYNYTAQKRKRVARSKKLVERTKKRSEKFKARRNFEIYE